MLTDDVVERILSFLAPRDAWSLAATSRAFERACRALYPAPPFCVALWGAGPPVVVWRACRGAALSAELQPAHGALAALGCSSWLDGRHPATAECDGRLTGGHVLAYAALHNTVTQYDLTANTTVSCVLRCHATALMARWGRVFVGTKEAAVFVVDFGTPARPVHSPQVSEVLVPRMMRKHIDAIALNPRTGAVAAIDDILMAKYALFMRESDPVSSASIEQLGDFINAVFTDVVAYQQGFLVVSKYGHSGGMGHDLVECQPSVGMPCCMLGRPACIEDISWRQYEQRKGDMVLGVAVTESDRVLVLRPTGVYEVTDMSEGQRLDSTPVPQVQLLGLREGSKLAKFWWTNGHLFLLCSVAQREGCCGGGSCLMTLRARGPVGSQLLVVSCTPFHHQVTPVQEKGSCCCCDPYTF
eukprot:m51a1_g4291 hypothetical protein (414) ;mRNA; r:403761-405428